MKICDRRCKFSTFPGCRDVRGPWSSKPLGHWRKQGERRLADWFTQSCSRQWRGLIRARGGDAVPWGRAGGTRGRRGTDTPRAPGGPGAPCGCPRRPPPPATLRPTCRCSRHRLRSPCPSPHPFVPRRPVCARHVGSSPLRWRPPAGGRRRRGEAFARGTNPKPLYGPIRGPALPPYLGLVDHLIWPRVNEVFFFGKTWTKWPAGREWGLSIFRKKIFYLSSDV